MREIKFRAKTKCCEIKWVYGHYYYDIVALEHNIVEGAIKWIIDPQTLGEYIGRKDKNSTEIYEGNVVEWRYSCADTSVFRGEVIYDCRVLEIGYEHNTTLFVGFILKCYDSINGKDEIWYTSISELAEYEVIGNIYENPELLEAS